MDKESVTVVLKEAHEAVKDAGISQGLREPAFVAAIALRAGGGPSSGVDGSGAARQEGSQVGDLTSGPGDAPDAMMAIAEGLSAASGGQFTVKELERIYAVRDGVPELKVRSSDLPNSKAAGTVDVALLTMAGRQLAAVEEYTEAELLRETTKKFGKFDVGNFAKHVGRLDHLVLTDGTGRAAKRRLTNPGLEEAAARARAYLGDGSDG